VITRSERGDERLPATGPRTMPEFVGRGSEVEWLVRLLDAAVGGEPRVALLIGDPGIGKTRLLRELQAIARRRNVDVCTARGYDDVVVPFLPLVESLLPRLDDLPRELELDAALIRQLAHGRAGSPRRNGEPAPGDNGRLRLMLAVSRVVLALARVRPLLFVLDDLHWVDQASLELFAHLVFTVADAAGRERVPLLIVGATRAVGNERPVARALARFKREAICQTLELSGLTEGEVAELIRSLGLRRPSHQLIASVHETTRGNPFFVQELVHELVRRGALEQRGGALVSTASALDVPLPADVTGPVATHVAEASAGCREMLQVAAFLGDPFTRPVLAAVTSVPDDRLLTLLDEALGHGLLIGEGAAYQFAHPLIRQSLYAQIGGEARRRLHARIADALERLYGTGTDDRVLALARHLEEAGDAAEAGRVLDVARRAGDHAFSTGAWREAARHYHAALAADDAARRLSPGERAGLHYQTGVAYFRDQDAGPCLDQFEKAVAGFTRAGDAHGLARALMGQTRAHFTLASVSYGTLIDPEPLHRVARELVDADPALAGFVCAELAQVYWTARDPAQAEIMGREALAVGERLGDDVLRAEAHRALALVESQRMEVPAALASLEQGLACARRGGDAWLQSHMLQRLPLPLVWLGRLDDAAARAREASELTRAIYDWGDHSLTQGALVCLATARGDFDVAERHAHLSMMMLRRSGYPWAGPTALPALACARTLRGALAEAEDALAILATPGEVFDEPGPAIIVLHWVLSLLVEAYAATSDTARAVVAERVAAIPAATSAGEQADAYALGAFCAVIELADLLGDARMAESVVGAPMLAAERGVVFSSGWVTLVPRVLGVAATLGRAWDRAAAWFERAATQATSAGARPELARTRLDQARMLVARGRRADRDSAAALLREAVGEFEQLGMRPFDERARALATTLRAGLPARRRGRDGHGELSTRQLDILVRLARGRSEGDIGQELVLGRETVARHVRRILQKTGARSAADAVTRARVSGLLPAAEAVAQVASEPHPLRIILFTDVQGSTSLIDRLGDSKARALLRTHDAIVRGQLEQCGGTEIKHTGDGIMAWFPAVTTALDCAVAIQRGLAEHNTRNPDERINVRVGLGAGEPIVEGGDLFGSAVTMAARICAHARPGQILVADVVRDLSRGKPRNFVDCGRITLKGFTQRVRLYEVPWRDPSP
jgi:class 3 adenylate cyclase/tetratricopeptide (TPR) repeat protein